MTARWTQLYPRSTWLTAVATLVFIDQISKSYFSTILKLNEAVKVTEWFNFVHVLNPGAAFSFLADVFIVCAALTWCFASLREPASQPAPKSNGKVPS